MKKYSICNVLEYIPASDVDEENGIITLKDGATFTRVSSKSKIVYQTDTETTSAGTILKEVVTFTGDITSVSGLLNRLQNYLLILTIDNENTIVGSVNYPFIKKYSDNKIIATITFTRQSAL